MIVQDFIALPTFNPHDGPITHSSTGSKPDSPVQPLFPKLFLARGLICNSRATVLVIYSGNRRNIQSHCFGPLSHVVSDIEWFPIRLKLLTVPSYFTLDIFLSIYSRVTFYHIPWVICQVVSPVRSVLPKMPIILFRKYDGTPEERDEDFIMIPWSRGMKTATQWIDLFEKSNQDRWHPLKFHNQNFPPYSTS